MPYPKTRFILAGMVSLLTVACMSGQRVERFPPAQQPAGVAATLSLFLGSDILGEVLAVEQDALLVLVDASSPNRLAGKLARIPFSRITWGQSRYADGSRNGMPADRVPRDNVRLLSRYPQGVSEELLVRLEVVYGPVEVLDPGSRE